MKTPCSIYTQSETKRGPERSCRINTKYVPLVEFKHLVFTRMPGESYHRGLRTLLLCLCDVFPALINSLVCRPCSIQVTICNSMCDTNLM